MNSASGNTTLARHLLWAAIVGDALLLFFGLCSTTFTNSVVLLVVSYLLIIASNIAVGWYAFTQGYIFEWRVNKRWQKVCQGLGGNFEAEGMDWRATVREGLIGTTSATFGFRSVRDAVVPQAKKVYPKIREVRGDWSAWTGVVMSHPGQDVDSYSKKSAAFSHYFGVPFMVFENAGAGLIRVRAGRVPVPEPYEYVIPAVNGGNSQKGMPQNTGYRGGGLLDVARTVNFGALFEQEDKRALMPGVPLVPSEHVDYRKANVWAAELALLQNVPMAKGLDGQVWHMPIEGKHVLAAARSGGGKGSIVWSLVLRLEPAWRLGLVKFWGCDPKRLELAIGRDWWAHYADTDVSMVELLEEAVSEMYKVGDQLKGNARCFTPSRKTPLNVVVIDELGYLSSLLGDRKLQTRADNAIRQLLNQGRSNSFSVVACLQDPRKSVVDYRDSFMIRIAGGLDNAEMVDLVLGKGMWDAGAKAELIPHGKEGAGVAYVLDAERAMQPRLVRAAWVSDSAIRNALNPAVRAQAEAYETQDDDNGYEFGYSVE